MPNEYETRPASLKKKSTFETGKQDDHSFHWLIAERSGHPVVCEWMEGHWHTSGEIHPVSPNEMYRRGWRWHSQVKIPKELEGQYDAIAYKMS